MKNFRVIIILITIGVLGVVSLVIGIRDSVIMASPVVDLTHIDEEGFRKLKKNTHVQIDVAALVRSGNLASDDQVFLDVYRLVLVHGL